MPGFCEDRAKIFDRGKACPLMLCSACFLGRNWFTRNYLIGKASLQLSFVNKRQHHLCLGKEVFSVDREVMVLFAC